VAAKQRIHTMTKTPSANFVAQQPTVEKLAYTVREFCAATGIGKTSTYELIKERKLKAVKAAGRRLILRSDAQAFLESCGDAA
jgi:excisionase family DNA binding protein